MKRLLKILLRLGVGVVFLALAAVALAWLSLRASLAQLDGERPIPGLEARVTIERDALGVPTIVASNRVDAARALGFVHAQERFFQMDLLRRRGAGELSALFGAGAFEYDQDLRRNGFRECARRELVGLPTNQRAVMEAYTGGVNSGLDALRVRPPEYLLLRLRPEPWRPEDCLLVGFAMFFSLQDSAGFEDLRVEAARAALPPAAADFFLPRGSDWDAALDGSEVPAARIPGPDVLNFSRNPPAPARADAGTWDETLRPGSNSWAVEGAASATGAAIVADDMHLDLGMPNIWYRVCLRWTDAKGEPRRIVGVSLAGIPILVVGSTGRIAWGFTNATLDTTDVVIVEVDPANPGRYRTPEGWRDFENVIETFDVRGSTNRTVTQQRTIWGPVIGDAGPGRKKALCWIPHQPGALNMGMLDLEDATSVAEALDIAPRCGVPVQNFLVGDRAGGLGWTLIGKVPRRAGFDGSAPVLWADGTSRWEGWLAGTNYPRWIAPAGGRLWTANNRILGSPEYLALGPWNTDPGARARQIRDDLLKLRAPVHEADLLSIHKDDRAVFLGRWRELLSKTLADPGITVSAGTNASRIAALRARVDKWEGRAATESVGYRVVRAFRFKVIERVVAPVAERCRAAGRPESLQTDRVEQAVWALIESRPAHLLDPKFPDWDALLADAMKAVLGDFARQGVGVEEATWGRRNTIRIQHPLSRAVPQLSRWLDIEPAEVPGDDHMPRVQGVAFGPSERMVVSPGHEERGIFNMPGGQSGHFLSPFYRAGHEAWLKVEPTPLLPGPARHSLTLVPRE